MCDTCSGWCVPCRLMLHFQCSHSSRGCPENLMAPGRQHFQSFGPGRVGGKRRTWEPDGKLWVVGLVCERPDSIERGVLPYAQGQTLSQTGERATCGEACAHLGDAIVRERSAVLEHLARLAIEQSHPRGRDAQIELELLLDGVDPIVLVRRHGQRVRCVGARVQGRREPDGHLCESK